MAVSCRDPLCAHAEVRGRPDYSTARRNPYGRAVELSIRRYHQRAKSREFLPLPRSTTFTPQNLHGPNEGLQTDYRPPRGGPGFALPAHRTPSFCERPVIGASGFVRIGILHGVILPSAQAADRVGPASRFAKRRHSAAHAGMPFLHLTISSVADH